MDSLHIPKIQIYITTRCNLKCKLCGTYCPYLKNPRDLDYDVFKKDITRFFELVDTVGRMELTGGEPLLNPRLPDMVDFLRDFGSRVEDFRLLSNGRSLPSDKLLKAVERISASDTGFTVLVDDYGPQLSPCAEDAALLYKNAGAKVERRDYYGDSMYMGGWVDYGLLQEMKRTRGQILQNQEKCACVKLQMRSMWEGVIYPCGRGIYFYHDTPPPPTLNILTVFLFMIVQSHWNKCVMKYLNFGTANITKCAVIVTPNSRRIKIVIVLRNSLYEKHFTAKLVSAGEYKERINTLLHRFIIRNKKKKYGIFFPGMKAELIF